MKIKFKKGDTYRKERMGLAFDQIPGNCFIIKRESNYRSSAVYEFTKDVTINIIIEVGE